MTTLEVKLDLPDRLAREALAAGLLTPKALRQMVKDAMQRRAAQTLLAGAEKATKAGSKPLSIDHVPCARCAIMIGTPPLRGAWVHIDVRSMRHGNSAA